MDMRRGFQIGTIRGIPIRIHVTFLVVLPFLAYGFGRSFIDAARLAGVPPERLSGSPWLWGLLIAVALFLSVLVHELAHSLYALRKGGKVRSITLLMIGGVSELAEGPKKPGEEAMMALVGPLTSLGLGVVLLALLRASRGLHSFDLSFALFHLAELNLLLGAFNLLPAFPMDGGRVLRGVLARRRGMVQATRIAAAVGKLFAVLFGVAGFLSMNFLLMIVAFFVFVGAEGEERGVEMRAALGDLRVADLMVPSREAVSPVETVFAVAERMVRARRTVLPVAEDGEVLGVVTLEAVEAVPRERRGTARARDVMAKGAVVAAADRVTDALQAIAERGVAHLAVAEAGQLLGTISQADILRGVRLRELETSQHPPSGGTAPRA